MSDLVGRLREREKRHRECIANSQIVWDLMQPQMEKFEKREGHNVYAVRLAVDHKSSIRTTTKEADEIKEAADRIEALEEALREIGDMATQPLAAVAARQALEQSNDTD